MSNTKTKDKTKLPDKQEPKTSEIIEFTDNIQKSTSINGIFKSRIIETKYYEMNNSWYDIVYIEFGFNNRENIISYFPISGQNNYIDDDLKLLYKYLDKNPEDIKDNNIVGEKVPVLVYNGKKNIYVPRLFDKNSMINTLLYSNYVSPTKDAIRFDVPKLLRYIGVLGIFTFLVLGIYIGFVLCIIYTAFIFSINKQKLRGKII